MTDQRDENKVPETGVAASSPVETATPSISRRALLRGASAAVPTVLTLNSGAVLAASSFSMMPSGVVETVEDGEFYVCLEGAKPGQRFYYDGAPAKAISAQRWFVKASELHSNLKPQHVDKVDKVVEAIAKCQKYRGDQLCADGDSYVPLAANSSTDPIVNFGVPDLTAVKVTPGTTASSSAWDSISSRLNTTALDL